MMQIVVGYISDILTRPRYVNVSWELMIADTISMNRN